MPVVPNQANRVAADGLHTFELQVGPDRRRVQNPLAGPLVSARGARALGPDMPVRYPVNPLVGPGQFQDLVGLMGAKGRSARRSWVSRTGLVIRADLGDA